MKFGEEGIHRLAVHLNGIVSPEEEPIFLGKPHFLYPGFLRYFHEQWLEYPLLQSRGVEGAICMHDLSRIGAIELRFGTAWRAVILKVTEELSLRTRDLQPFKTGLKVLTYNGNDHRNVERIGDINLMREFPNHLFSYAYDPNAGTI